MSSPQRRDSEEGSNGRPRVEPSFFGNRLQNNNYNNNNSQSKQQQPKDNRVDENDWNSQPPPPYSPPNEPSSMYSSGSTPSAPPLDESIPPTNPHYQRHPTYSTSDSNSYPQNYNQPTSYGSIQQPRSPTSPSPHSPPNTSDANHFHWPWRLNSAPQTPPTPPVPSTTSLQPSSPPPHPPIISPSSYSITPPSQKKRSCCRIFSYVMCILIVLWLLSSIIDSLFGDDSNHICTGGVPWSEFPARLDYQDNLRISTRGGRLTGGRVILKSIDEEHPQPAIYVKSRVSPSKYANIPGLDYSLIYDKYETHLQILIPDSSRICLSMDLEIYVDKTTKMITLDVQNSPILIDGDATTHTNVLKVKSSNSPIRFNSPWNGTFLSLQTTNAAIELRGPITSNGTVSLHTTNDHILTADVTATDVITMLSTNGYIKTGALSARIVSTTTDNAPITVQSIHADQSELLTSNGKLLVPYANVSSMIKAVTTNAIVELHIYGSNQIMVTAQTSNNPARLFMPNEYEGSFEITTSGHQNIVYIDHNTHIKTHIYRATEGCLIGARYEDEILGGQITLRTSNAAPFLSFDN